MIWNRLSILKSTGIFAGPREAARTARRWRMAKAAAPGIENDLIVLGGVLTMQPVPHLAAAPAPQPIDPLRLSYEAGRRDLAIQLLSLMGLNTTEMNALMTENDDA